MKAKSVILLLFLVAAGVILWRAVLQPKRDKSSELTATTTTGAALPVPAPAPGKPPTEIVLEFGTEKREWIEAAVADFANQRPDIKVSLKGKGSLEAVQAILDGQDKPTIFSPADSLALKLLDSDWQTKTKTSLLGQGADAPEPLLITPLVFAIWEDRATALLKAAGGHLSWKVIQKAVSSNRGWPAVGGKPEWGFVKLGHTDPTKSNSGLQALLLMTFEYHNKTSGLEIADLLKPDYQGFVASIERGVPKFETSTGTFMTDMVRFGPSKYDIAVVYESLAIAQIENAQGRWGNLRIYYPDTTLWSDHPAAILSGDWVSEAERVAARALLAFLHGRPMQERALAFGFRPADPAVPLHTPSHDPYTRLAQYGVRVDVPQAAASPEAPVIRNLLTMWARVVGTR